MKFLHLILTFLVCSSVFAQNLIRDKKYIFEFKDGTTIIGTYLNSKEGNIWIKDMSNEEVYVPKVMVANIHVANDNNIIDGEYWFSNLHDTRYFFSPSAFGLEKGEGYYSHSYFFLWQTQYGISEDISIGFGTSFIGFPTSLNIKCSKKLQKNLNTAFGYFWVGDLFNFIGDDKKSLINLPYLVITSGNIENNLTIGFGYNLQDMSSNNNTIDRLAMNVGGITRTSKRFSLVFEAWLLNIGDDEPIAWGGPGVRYYRKINRFSAKNGTGSKTFDVQLLMSSLLGGTIVPKFGASQHF
ncbi:MAG: hypothetical protein CMP70_03850 [Flavobacteriales bacterium]|nr:hypothetical protein [Flavobacteriales bacterium]|tara:strand:+ start:677 stop:1567 length:891 start_codon:yes stop_codon:yes gene_type:complete